MTGIITHTKTNQFSQYRRTARFGVSKATYGSPFQERWLRRHEGGVHKPVPLEKRAKPKKGGVRDAA